MRMVAYKALLLVALNAVLIVNFPVTVLSFLDKLTPYLEVELGLQIFLVLAVNWLAFKGRYVASVALVYVAIVIGSVGGNPENVLLKASNEYIFLVFVPLVVFLVSFAFSRLGPRSIAPGIGR